MKILVYNENEKSRLVVGQLLKELSFSVILADSEEKLFEELKTESIDLVILDVNSFDNFTDDLISELKETVLKDELNAIKDEVKEDLINHSELNYMKRNEMDNLTEKYEKAQAEPTQDLKHFETLQKEQNTEKEF